MTMRSTPSQLDPHHFRDGDAIQYGPEAVLLVGVVTDAQPDAAGLVTIRMPKGESRTHVGNLLHRDGCKACHAYQENWAAQQHPEWHEQRSHYTLAALDLADALRDRGLLQISAAGLACGHGDDYIVAPDAPLPDWLHTALKGVVFTAPEGPWPNWGRTDHPIDWPTLIAQHPDALGAEQDMLDANSGGSWASIAEAFTLVRSVDPGTRIDVFLWVSTTGLVTVEPTGFWAHADIPAELAAQVDDILVAGGRDRHALHTPTFDDTGTFDARRGWLLEC